MRESEVMVSEGSDMTVDLRDSAGPTRDAAGDYGEIAAGAGLEIAHLSVIYPPASVRGWRRGRQGLQMPAVHAVTDVSVRVPLGSIVALLGPSGCGKSSLLRAVAGLEDVATGSVTWNSKDVVKVPVHRRGFGLMFQDGQLFPFRDVAGNIAYGLIGLPRAERQRRVGEMLDLVGLSGFEHRALSTLSGGQAQRVALARALAPRPRLLLLDEPLSALDRLLREQLAVDIRRILRQQGTTALYITHDHTEAEAVADTVGVMDRGRLLAVGTMACLRARPPSAEVARFVAVPGDEKR